MPNPADTGNSATIVFGTSGFVAYYNKIGGTKQTREKLRDSHLGTTNYHTYMPSDLAEPGEFEAEFQYDPQSQPPLLNAPETVTITYPVPSGLTNGATLSGTGFLTERTSPDLANGEIMVGGYVFAWDGKTEPTFAPAT